MKYKLKPYEHQLKAIELARDKRDFGLLWDLGTGKTGGMINILRDKYAQEGSIKRTLIVSPVVTLFNWKEEFKIHSYVPQDKIIVVHGSKNKKLKALQQIRNPLTKNYDARKIVIINYESLLSEPIFKILKEWHPQCIVYDEAHYLKNHKAKRSKKAVILSMQAEHRFILTGTSILKNASDIFMQFLVLDKGETFGHNYYVFQRKYMYDENSAWAHVDNHYPKWKLREDMEEELNQKIYTKCTKADKDECLDLPPLIKQQIPLEMTSKQAKLYKEMKRDLITFLETSEGNKAIVANAAVVKALRLMQITSGFASTDDGDVVEIPNDPKSKAVEEYLTELTPDHKVILWCAFRHNYTILSKICTKLGIKHVFLTGDQNLREKQDAMDTFNTDPECRVVIANRRAGGIGINLVAASYSIVVSRNFALADELQSEARNYRGGSQIHEKIVKIDLVMKDTIEEQVIESLNNKKEIAHRVLNFIKE